MTAEGPVDKNDVPGEYHVHGLGQILLAQGKDFFVHIAFFVKCIALPGFQDFLEQIREIGDHLPRQGAAVGPVDPHVFENFRDIRVIVFQDRVKQPVISFGKGFGYFLHAAEIIDNDPAGFAKGEIGHVGIGMQESIRKKAV